eukprot:TRINITY_DN4176_c0_g1_i1.p1 TRINITY_DN4176_c0_g1~~TRINITY_DN4176_c0_g1_i1.p1  ORF type:complete len:371 (-),score=74.52 TRINITY_DN4176_c0_g1_i1:44-1156(-)
MSYTSRLGYSMHCESETDDLELVLDVSQRVIHRKRRKKMGYHESSLLESAYQTTPWPSPRQREWLARETGLSTRTVQIWFQNRRVKEKKGCVNKWTEVTPHPNNQTQLHHSQTAPIYLEDTNLSNPNFNLPAEYPLNMSREGTCQDSENNFLDTLVSNLKSSFLSSMLSPGTALSSRTPHQMSLFDACQLGFLSKVMNLASQQDLESTDEEGNTPIMIAASRGHLEVVKYLADMGSNICHSNKKGKTALMMCIQNRDLATSSFLINHSSIADLLRKDTVTGQDVISQCVVYNLIELIPSLIIKGVPINQTDRNGMTCLMHACLMNNVEVISYLIRRGANLMTRDSSGRSCLEYVKSVNHPSLDFLSSSIL